MSWLKSEPDAGFDLPGHLLRNLFTDVLFVDWKKQALFFADVRLEEAGELCQYGRELSVFGLPQPADQKFHFPVFFQQFENQASRTGHALHRRKKDLLLRLKMNGQVTLEKSDRRLCPGTK